MIRCPGFVGVDMSYRGENPLPALACVAALSGCCASVPMAPEALDRSAKSFAAEPGRGNLYVYRSSNLFGCQGLCQVIVDDKALGGLAAGTYHVVSLAPGRHTATVTGWENQASLPVMIEAGDNQFTRIEWKLQVFQGRWSIHALSDVEGRKQVSSGNRAAGLGGP